MGIATVKNVCTLPEHFTFLSPGEAIRHDSFGLGLYPCEMNGKVGYYAMLSEEEEQDADEVTMF